MKIALSTIAFRFEEREIIAALLKQYNIHGIEIAPGSFGDNLLLDASQEELIQYQNLFRKNYIDIVSMQALLYGGGDLHLFTTSESRSKMMSYLKSIISKGAKLGANRFVFGSPKNRIKNGLSKMQADEIALPFFKELGSYANSHGAKVVIEHNHQAYGGDYLTTVNEVKEFVQKVRSSGIGLNMDTGGIILSGDTEQIILDSPGAIDHFQISQPYLESLSKCDKKVHNSFAKALKKIKYQGWLSIEMKQPNPNGSNIDEIKKSIEVVKMIYG